MTPAEMVALAAETASKDDRWLFIFTVGILLVSLVFSMKWVVAHFTKRCEKLEEEIVELRKQHVDYITNVGSETLKNLISSQTSLQDCAKALENNAQINKQVLDWTKKLEGLFIQGIHSNPQ